MRHRIELACALAVLLAAAAHAQTERSGNEAQKFMQQYQQIAAEKTALQGQLAQMKKDLDAAQSELAAAKKERDALKAHAGGSSAALAQATAAKEQSDKSLETYKQRMSELVAKFRETAATLRDTEADRAKARQELTERNSAFDRCAEDNFKLYEVNSEILDRYDHVGLFTKVSASEPFTRLTRARIENLVDEYRARALELRVKKTQSEPEPAKKTP
jgi:chromosome segregation ATPase